MLYKVMTLPVGNEALDDQCSRALSREAKRGFIVKNVTSVLVDSKLINSYLLQRVPINHVPNEPGDPSGLKRIVLGNEVHYWDPCGDDQDVIGTNDDDK
ncbi:TPA: hypothetical protein ACN35N_004433 [Vibrio parahaemolyticus]|uniref:hypothetical protein n=1 Tax=Vibrio parahaemolyticus TaxID=670 RepID=UPI00111E6288|nr:hypothetical protein [Vibrio parahaemolyticus]EME0159021.1 hypothetical protein [Vibrio vulnificus]TNZ55832.1 hypothetical protein CGK45_22480 [Vibrio parahaemolyticus]